VTAGLAGTLGLVQALGDAGVAAPLWALSCGAVAATAGEVLASPVQAQVWGLGRVAGLEHPDRWGGLIDLPPVLGERAWARLCAVLAGSGEDQVAVRDTGVYGRRLVRAPLPGGGQQWVPRGSVLITGGTGAVAGHVARWLADQGAPRVVLASRSGPAADGTAGLATRLAAAGTAVEVVACDVAVRAEAAGLLARIGAAGPRLGAVMHTAGVLDDGVLDRLDTARLGGVLAAKAAGAAHLDELTAEMGLDAFVLFSSAAATLGSPGQGNYAAANAFLDGLAQNRRGRGLPAVSVAWGRWGGGGLSQASELVRRRLGRGPLPEMDPVLAVRALGEVLAGGDSVVAVMDVDWAQFASVPGADQVPFLRDLPDVRRHARDQGTSAGGSPEVGELRQRLAGLPAAERERVLAGLVRAEAAAVLGYTSPEAIEPDRAFRDLGFDSLTAVELRNRLTAATGLPLPATLIFDYPTPAALAEYLLAAGLQDTPPPVPLLAELDKLGSLMSAATQDDRTRQEVTDRLQELLSRWTSTGSQADSQSAAQKIQSATDDEIFEFIHKELGR
jgi:acyl carrier protein